MASIVFNAHIKTLKNRPGADTDGTAEHHCVAWNNAGTCAASKRRALLPEGDSQGENDFRMYMWHVPQLLTGDGPSPT